MSAVLSLSTLMLQLRRRCRRSPKETEMQQVFCPEAEAVIVMTVSWLTRPLHSAPTFSQTTLQLKSLGAVLSPPPPIRVFLYLLSLFVSSPFCIATAETLLLLLRLLLATAFHGFICSASTLYNMTCTVFILYLFYFLFSSSPSNPSSRSGQSHLSPTPYSLSVDRTLQTSPLSTYQYSVFILFSLRRRTPVNQTCLRPGAAKWVVLVLQLPHTLGLLDSVLSPLLFLDCGVFLLLLTGSSPLYVMKR